MVYFYEKKNRTQRGLHLDLRAQFYLWSQYHLSFDWLMRLVVIDPDRVNGNPGPAVSW